MSSETAAGPNYRVPALDKGLDVLERLAAGGVALTQAQLGRELGRRPTELFRTLTTLERRGYVRRDPVSGAYGLTLRLFELGHAHSPHEGLTRAAERPMRALSDALREGCHLSVLHRDRLLVLHQAESPARVRISVEVGSTIEPRRSASGRALLAALDEPERAAVLAADGGFAALTADGRAALLDALRTIAERGYEVATGESVPGVTDLAVVIGGTGGWTLAALAVSALPRDREAFLAEALGPVRSCAAEIARAAGLSGTEGTA